MADGYFTEAYARANVTCPFIRYGHGPHRKAHGQEGEHIKCMGSACAAAWRWRKYQPKMREVAKKIAVLGVELETGWEIEVEDTTPADPAQREGYCGACGKPEE